MRGSPDRVARIGPPTLRVPTTAQRSVPLDSAAAPRRSGDCTARCNECTMQQTRPHGGRGAARVSTLSTRSSERGQQWAGAAQWGSRTARARAAQRGAKQAERPCAPAGPRAGVKARQWLTGQAIYSLQWTMRAARSACGAPLRWEAQRRTPCGKLRVSTHTRRHLWRGESVLRAQWHWEYPATRSESDYSEWY